MKILLLLLALLSIWKVSNCCLSKNWFQCYNKWTFVQPYVLTIAYISDDNTFISRPMSMSTLGLLYACRERFSDFETSILTACLCRETYETTTFVFSMVPFLYNNSYETAVYQDRVALCMAFPRETVDDFFYLSQTEIFDMFESKKTPKSLIDPFTNDQKINKKSPCTDIMGNPTKDVYDQNVCLLSVEISRDSDDYIYSGPFLGSALTIMDKTDNQQFIEYCYAIKRLEKFGDTCQFEHSIVGSKFQCCCYKRYSNCSPPKKTYDSNKLFCLAGNYSNTDVRVDSFMSADYIDNYNNYACSTTISLLSNDTKPFTFEVVFGAQQSCEKKKEIIVNDQGRPCSSRPDFPQNVIIKKCCKNGHFCNRHLIEEKYTTTWCSRQTAAKKFALEIPSSVCTVFYDLQIKNVTHIIPDYNAVIPSDQKPYIVTLSSASGIQYQLHYIYINITMEDHLICIRNYKIASDTRPFIQVFCEADKCDDRLPVNQTFTFPTRTFQCQNLTVQSFNNDVKAQYLSSLQSSIGWMCYVKIINEKIEAGILTDFNDHPRCLHEDYMTEDGTFCCSSVFNTSQADTICTVDKLVDKKITSPIDSSGGSPSGPIQYQQSFCEIKDLSSFYQCPPGSECFASRALGKKSLNGIIKEPSGCVENTELNIIDNIEMASISLACLTNLKDRQRCSVVRSVEGGERVVCCCGKEECKNDMRNLPKNIGKPISSYRNP